MDNAKIMGLVEKLNNEDDDIVNKLILIGEKVVEQLTSALLHSDWNIKYKIAEILGEIGDKRAIPSLIRTIKESKNSYVREACTESLGKIGYKTTIPFLIVLLQDTDPQVRVEASLALGKMKAVGAVPHLCDNLDATNDTIRWAAVRALGAIKDASAAVFPLISLLDEEKNSNIRDWTAWALGEIGDTRAIKPLIKALKNDKSFNVRQEADLALEEIAKKYGYSKEELLASLYKVPKEQQRPDS